MNDATIVRLRSLFRISVATFDFAIIFQPNLKPDAAIIEMQQLHKDALKELEKDKPCPLKVENLLIKMAALAEINSRTKNLQPFPKGGI